MHTQTALLRKLNAMMPDIAWYIENGNNANKRVVGVLGKDYLFVDTYECVRWLNNSWDSPEGFRDYLIELKTTLNKIIL